MGFTAVELNVITKCIRNDPKQRLWHLSVFFVAITLLQSLYQTKVRWKGMEKCSQNTVVMVLGALELFAISVDKTGSSRLYQSASSLYFGIKTKWYQCTDQFLFLIISASMADRRLGFSDVNWSVF